MSARCGGHAPLRSSSKLPDVDNFERDCAITIKAVRCEWGPVLQFLAVKPPVLQLCTETAVGNVPEKQRNERKEGKGNGRGGEGRGG